MCSLKGTNVFRHREWTAHLCIREEGMNVFRKRE
jgi:hypothetical protein